LRETWDREPPPLVEELHELDRAAGRKVLDYGCGNGYLLGLYARRGAEVYGLDVTDRAIELARSRFALIGLDGTFIRNDGATIPFESGTFDVVCSLGVLHHIPDPAPVVAELFRVLKPGGRLVVMLYNRDSWRYRVACRFDLRPGETVEERVRRNDGRDIPYGRVCSRAEARRLLSAFQDHRFVVAKLNFGDLALWRRPLERALVRLVPRRAVEALGRRIGWNLYCVARKPG